jgi:hypothetical protein
MCKQVQMSASEDEPVQAVMYQPPARKRPGRPCNDDRPMAPPLKVMKGTGSEVVLKQYVDARGRLSKEWVEVVCAKGEIATLDVDMSSRWVFCPNKDQQKKADYHSSFKSDNFIPYFKERLLPACLRVFPGKRLVFVMDNAGYHVSSSFEVPGTDAAMLAVDRSSRKEALLRFIQYHRGEMSANIGMLRAELEEKFVAISTELGCDIARLLRDQGHLLLLTPPRCSTWQPIELYWASVKNEVASLFKQGRSLQETRTQLEASLTKWGTQAHCSKLIAHTTKQVKTWWDSARQADSAAEATQQSIQDIESDDNNSDDDDRFSVHSHEFL